MRSLRSFVPVQRGELGARGFAIVNLVITLAWLVLVARTGRLHDELAGRKS